jgi:hypothetical protein
MLFANESTSPLKESLAYFLVSLYFSLRWVSLAEYILVLRVCFPTCCRWANVLWLFYQLLVSYNGWWLGPRAWSLHMSYLMLLLGITINWHCISNYVCVWSLKLIASAMLLWTWFVITLYFKLRCISMVLRTLCNMWLWLLNLYDLGWYVVGLKSIVISRTTGLYGLKFAKLSASANDFLT